MNRFALPASLLPTFFLPASLLLAVALFASQSHAQTSSAISADDVKHRIQILASDSLEGRMTGTVGAERAAAYIAREFRRVGLTPIDSTKSFFQSYTFREMMAPASEPRKSAVNVVGMLRGSDPKLSKEYVIVGAHYDHLGRGGIYALDKGDTNFHFGADDNASGTAGVMELAEHFAQNPKKLKRSIVFICFSGEELGLFGSAHFAKNPLVDLKKTVAMVNMDMIGRMTDKKMIVEGLGSSPDWKAMVNAANKEKLTLAMKQEAVGPSDHTSFYQKDVPVLFLWTGLHSDYHKSSDTWDKINASGEHSVLNVASRVIETLATRAKPITFTKAPIDTTKKTGSFSVYVGGVPDYTWEGKGVKISSVTEGSPAQQAGMKGEDVIVKFGGAEINNIYDYTGELGKHKPDDVLEIVVQRGTETVALPLTLGKRSSAH